MKLNREQERKLRGMGHALKPVVTVADKGLSDNVMQELEIALNHHELIKVKLRVGERDAKAALLDELCQRTGAIRVQMIGHVALIYRRHPEQPRIAI